LAVDFHHWQAQHDLSGRPTKAICLPQPVGCRSPGAVASTAEGFSSGEAEQRLAANGLNELREGDPISPLHIFLASLAPQCVSGFTKK
jgi:hypothetical protein